MKEIWMEFTGNVLQFTVWDSYSSDRPVDIYENLWEHTDLFYNLWKPRFRKATDISITFLSVSDILSACLVMPFS